MPIIYSLRLSDIEFQLTEQSGRLFALSSQVVAQFSKTDDHRTMDAVRVHCTVAAVPERTAEPGRTAELGRTAKLGRTAERERMTAANTIGTAPG